MQKKIILVSASTCLAALSGLGVADAESQNKSARTLGATSQDLPAVVEVLKKSGFNVGITGFDGKTITFSATLEPKSPLKGGCPHRPVN